MTKNLNPNMSTDAMLDCFIFITKGSRVIDWRMFNWDLAPWVAQKLVCDKIYSVADMKNYFAHRGTWCNPFQKWLTHPGRRVVRTFNEAMEFVYKIGHEAELRKRGIPTIDVAAIVRNARRSPELIEIQVRQGKLPPWSLQLAQAEKERASKAAEAATAAARARLIASLPSA